MLNRIVLMGRLTKDPELRHTQTNIPVVNFSLAVDRNYSKSGEKETDFFDVIAWQKRAEFVAQYFTKGQLVCVDGQMRRRQYVDSNNVTRYVYEVVADSVFFAGYNKPTDDTETTSYETASADFDPFEDVA